MYNQASQLKGLAGIAPGDTVSRQSEITALMSELHEQVTRVECIAEELQKRLQTVTRDEPPSVSEKCQELPAPGTQLGRGLQSFGTRLKSANSIMSGILNRLEV